MQSGCFDTLASRIARVSAVRRIGRVMQLRDATVSIAGLSRSAAIGDQVEIRTRDGAALGGEVLRLDESGAEMLPNGPLQGVALGDPVTLLGPAQLAPDEGWIGRIVDPYGAPLDGRALMPGPAPVEVRRQPPEAAARRAMGARIDTGVAVFNTMLPLVRGQRVGLFAGAGVGKSMLIAALAKTLQADVVVVALVGERGREVAHFAKEVLGAEGLRRSVIVAAPSDQSALMRRRCAWSAMAVAEYFRDRGRHVLLLVDSVTRFAEAHRDAALAAGESPTLGGYPPSLAHQIMALAERAGPGTAAQGDITAVFSVLVAGSDMDGPVADTLRGVLDGHVVLSREIAERGRYPAVDVLRSISRSLPAAADADENALIADARRLLGAYDRSELMLQSGLYVPGNDALTDRAIRVWPQLDALIGRMEPETVPESFARLRACLDETDAPEPAG